MCGNTQTTRREYPHNIPPVQRRFKNGAWQKPTQKGRGWQASEGLAGMTYEQGLQRLADLNSGRVDGYTRNLIDVTTPDQIPVTVAEALGAGDRPTNPNHRRFNTVTGNWEKPNHSMTGWINSGAAGLSYEAGIDRYFRDGNRHGYINVGQYTPGFQPNAIVEGGLIEPVAELTEFTRNWNSALGMWEKPNRDLTGMVPSSGLAGKTFGEGIDYLVENFPADFFTLTFDGAALPVEGAEIVPTEDVSAFENFLNEDESLAQSGQGPFGTEFTPVLNVLPNGGVTVTVDARGAIALARYVVELQRVAPASQDAEFLTPLAATLAANESSLFVNAIETLETTPLGA